MIDPHKVILTASHKGAGEQYEFFDLGASGEHEAFLLTYLHGTKPYSYQLYFY